MHVTFFYVCIVVYIVTGICISMVEAATCLIRPSLEWLSSTEEATLLEVVEFTVDGPYYHTITNNMIQGQYRQFFFFFVPKRVQYILYLGSVQKKKQRCSLV